MKPSKLALGLTPLPELRRERLAFRLSPSLSPSGRLSISTLNIQSPSSFSSSEFFYCQNFFGPFPLKELVPLTGRVTTHSGLASILQKSFLGKQTYPATWATKEVKRSRPFSPQHSKHEHRLGRERARSRSTESTLFIGILQLGEYFLLGLYRELGISPGHI